MSAKQKKTSLYEALGSFRQWLNENQITEGDVRITFSDASFGRVLIALQQDFAILTREGQPIYINPKHPVRYFGFELSSQGDNRNPLRVFGDND